MAKKNHPDGSFPFAEAIDDVNVKFCELTTLVEGVATAHLRHLMVVGPQGLGKTYAIEQTLAKYRHRAKGSISVRKLSGHTTPLALFQTLYEHRSPRDILLIDDCDAVFRTLASVNLLKAATDSRPDRIVSWMTSAASARVEVPQFVYDGRIIVCTNHKPKGPLVEPVIDRFMVYRLDLSGEERVARIIAVLEQAYRQKDQSRVLDAVLTFLIRNHTRLGEKLSLRTAIKTVELAMYSENWEELAAHMIVEGA